MARRGDYRPGEELPGGFTFLADGRLRFQRKRTGEKAIDIIQKKTERQADFIRRASGEAVDADRGVKRPDRRRQEQRLSVYLAWWLETDVLPNHREADGRPDRTHDFYQNNVSRHIVPRLGNVRLMDLDAAAIREWVVGLEADRSAATADAARRTLRTALNAAVELGWLAGNPVTRRSKPKIERKEPAAMTPDTARGVLRAVAGDRHEVLYHLAILTGGRVSELIAVRWQDVDFDRCELRLSRQLRTVKGGVIEKGHRKNRDTAHVVPLSDRMVELLRAHRERQHFEARGWPEDRPAGLVFTNESGGYLARQFVTQHLQRLLEKAGLPHLTMHQFARHGASSLLTNVGHDERVRAQLLGQRDLAVNRRYSHADPDAVRRAVNDLDSLIGEAI